MKPAVKWGIAAASGAAVFLALRKMKKAQEQNADNTQLALQQLVESSQSSQIIETRGTWRGITQAASVPMGFYFMDLPPAVEGKTLINLYVESNIDTWRYGAVVSWQSKHSNMILCTAGGDLKGDFRVVGQWI